MTTVGQIMFKLGIDMSGFDKGIASASSSMKNLGKDIGQVGKSLTMGVTAPLVAVGTGAVLAANDFDKAFNTIRRGTGATGEALEGLKSDFEAVFKAVPAGAEDTATAIADLNTRMNVSGDALQGLSIQFLELSRITGTDVANNIESVTRTFGDWGIANENASESLDYLFRVSQETGAGVDQLGRQLVQYGAPLRQMGFDFETSAAMMGKFEKEGVNTELVLGSMRIALGKLAREGVTDTNEAFNILVDQIKNAGSVGEANALAIETFGARAGPDMAAAIREGRFEFDDLISSLREGTDTITGVGEETMSMEDKMAMLTQKLQVAVVPLGFKLMDMLETLMPTIEKVIGFIAGLIDRFTSLDPAIQNIIIVLAGVAAAIGPILMILGPIITTIGALMPLIGTLTAALPALGVAFTVATGPIGLIILAIAGLVIAGWYLYNNWDEVCAKVGELWEGVKNFLGGIWDGIAGLFDGGMGSILGILFPPLGLYQLVSNNWGPITDFVSDLWDGIVKYLGGMWDKLTDLFGGGFKAILGILFPPLGIAMLVQQNWGKITDAVKGIWNSVLPIFTNMGKDAITAGYNIVKGLWDGIWSLDRWIKDQVFNFAKGIFNSIKSGFGTLWPFSPSEAGVNIGEGLTGGISKGIEDTLRWVDSSIGTLETDMMITPTIQEISAIGGSTDGTGSITNNIMIDNMTVRNDNDIELISQKLFSMIDRNNRGRGVI